MSHPIVASCHGERWADAVRLAVVLARCSDQPIVLAGTFAEPSDIARPAAILERARDIAGRDVEVREAPASAGDRTEQLLFAARVTGASAIALGPDGAAVAADLIRHADCPVAVVTAESSGPPRALRRIGVADDGSVSSRTAVTAAIGLADQSDATLVLLAGAPSHHGSLLDPMDLSHRAQGEADRSRERLAAEAGLIDGLDVEQLVLRGDPAEMLAAAGADLDLLVCGSHGRGRLQSSVMGSVSTELLTRSRCAVLVVPPRARVAAALPFGVTTAG
jgi:nucleotide-binding universal stress UspA family protein